MADLLIDGQEAWSVTGNTDTVTKRSDGKNGSDITAATVNGPALGVRAIQTVLGNALTLKGSVASLAARLAVALAADGALAKGITFPASPIDGQPFYRVDTNQLYIYDAGEPAWKTVFQGQDISTLDHGALGGLGDDDHPQYQLVTAARDFTGDVKVKKVTPSIRLTGTESSAKDIRLVENAGLISFQQNDGSEGSPSWTSLATLPQMLMNLPKSVGSGSTRSHEGNVTVTTNDAMNGIHFFTNFTLNQGVQLTVNPGAFNLVIIATDTITINGTIYAVGAGQDGGTGAPGDSAPGTDGSPGTDQPGGQGRAGTNTSQGQAPSIRVHGIAYPGAVTGSAILHAMSPWLCVGGGGGGGGGGATGNPGGNGGDGGGSVVLIAPTIILSATSAINTSGTNGAAGSNGDPNIGGGGGGGGAGNIYMWCRSYSDLGCVFTQNGGVVGANGTGGSNGTNGVKQILIFH